MTRAPYRITIVSHTHWDREWYQPFQVFRFQLVELVDRLLDILDSTPAYHSFLLDGQTIVLEDYLAIRPKREADLRRHIQAGRLLIGPWHILPDEFLVSPEATVRNLMLGARVCARFGTRMPVGYTPDPFGHISQLPQILAGVGLEAAALQRGLGDEPTELWWEAPDGTRLLTIFFRAGYGNLAWAPTASDAFTRAVERQIELLSPHTHTPHLLLLNGTDHMLPQPELPELIDEANRRLGGRAQVVHGTLPDHVDAVRRALPDVRPLPVVRGELRSPKRSPLLPGVFSARMWIKQANDACQTALERYAEPASALAHLAGGADRRGELGQAWRYLIENHPHDSICGCSVDQVHEEMRARFAWSEQLAHEVITASLGHLARQIDGARLPAPPVAAEADAPAHAVVSAQTDRAVLVYNPLPGAQTGVVEITARWAGPRRRYRLLDQDGNDVPHRILDGDEIVFEQRDVTRDELSALLEQVEIGFYKGRLISDVSVWIDGGEARIEMVLPEYHTGQIGDFSGLVATLRRDERLASVRRCHLTTYLADNFRIAMVARDVPGVGYRAYRLANVPGSGPADAPPAPARITALENEWLRVEADPQDGTLRVTDKATGRTLSGLNRVEDGGDRGDEYNYCPPAHDTLVTRPVEPPAITCRDEGPFGQVMVIAARYALPAALADDRDARAPETVELPVTTTVRLVPGVRRVDVHTELDNRAQDHRLRVLFPAGVAAERAIVDGHFDRLERGPIAVTDTQGWAEQPTPTAAQRVFSAVEQDGAGLMVAARGLPEYEHVRDANGSTLALTLLRAVGWLSRDDLACRPGHAGPGRPTPGAQCIGPASYDYSLIPFGGESFGLDEAAHAAFAFAAPLRATASEAAQGPLPPELRFVALEPAAWVLTALKPAESGEGIVVRFYNSSAAAVSGRVEFGLPVDEVTPVNLLEEPVDLPGMRVEGRAAWLDVPGKRIVTLRVAFAAR